MFWDMQNVGTSRKARKSCNIFHHFHELYNVIIIIEVHSETKLFTWMKHSKQSLWHHRIDEAWNIIHLLILHLSMLINWAFIAFSIKNGENFHINEFYGALMASKIEASTCQWITRFIAVISNQISILLNKFSFLIWIIFPSIKV